MKIGSRGLPVKQLQLDLNRMAALVPGPMMSMVVADGDFGPMTERAVKQAQTLMGLVPDGVVDASTLLGIDHFIVNDGVKGPLVAPEPSGQTPWMDWFIKRDGWTEFDHDKELSQGWVYVGLNYSTVIGADHAWCAMSLNTALIKGGYKGNGRADAVSFEKYGTACKYVYGAIVPIRHPGGSHHVTTFDHWVDESKKVAALRGGNQGNRICVATFNLSGNSNGHDECVSGPRWPIKAA